MKYDLVFEGGGAKGMVFVGAYQEFVRRGHTYGRLLGTSAGAISATLLAAGYTPDELLKALNEREDGKSVFSGFMGEPETFSQTQVSASAIRAFLKNIDIKILPEFVEKHLDDSIAGMLAQNQHSRHFFAFVERGGWFSAHRFITWLQARLNTGPWKSGVRSFSQMTLSQFHAQTQVDLSLVASDTTDRRLLVLNHRTAPDCPVVMAVRMSMSIPLVWDEVVWSEDWGTYMGHDIAGHAIVDGGILSNFPIELFISDAPQVTRLMGEKGDNGVIGLLIDESLPVPPVPRARGLLVDVNVKPEELRTVQRLKRLLNTMTDAHDKMVIEEFEHLVARLPAAGYGTTEFDMSDEKRDALVAAGRSAMATYFEKLSPSRSVSRGVEAKGTGGSKQTADRIAARLLGD